MSHNEISTARTALRLFTTEDAADVFACISPAVTRFMSWEPPASAQRFSEVWRSWIHSIDDHSELYFVVRDRTDHRCLGIVGVHALATDTPELGIWLRQDVHGQRHGSELIGTVLDHVSSSHAVTYFEYPVAEENIASRRIAEAYGGKVEGKRITPKYTSVVYRIPPTPGSRHGPKALVMPA